MSQRPVACALVFATLVLCTPPADRAYSQPVRGTNPGGGTMGQPGHPGGGTGERPPGSDGSGLGGSGSGIQGSSGLGSAGSAPVGNGSGYRERTPEEIAAAQARADLERPDRTRIAQRISGLAIDTRRTAAIVQKVRHVATR